MPQIIDAADEELLADQEDDDGWQGEHGASSHEWTPGHVIFSEEGIQSDRKRVFGLIVEVDERVKEVCPRPHELKDCRGDNRRSASIRAASRSTNTPARCSRSDLASSHMMSWAVRACSDGPRR